MPEINQWTFASDACRTIRGMLAAEPNLPFTEARVEENAGIGRKRRDLTLYGRGGQAVLCGEIKLPDRTNGQSPYSDALITGAFMQRDMEHFNVTSIAQTNWVHCRRPEKQGLRQPA